MTSTEGVDCESPDSSLDDLYVEFDAQQVTVRTNVGEMHDYLASAYRPMLVERITSRIGELELIRVEGGFSLRGASELEFAGEIAALYEYVKHELLVQFIRGRQDLLWLHAATVERNEKAILFAGPSGQGKSTLSTRLCERGWNFMSDDIAPVRMSSNDVLPFPLTAFRRIGKAGQFDPRALETLEKESVSILPESIRHDAAPIAAIVFPFYRPEASPKLVRMAPGNAAFELLRSYTNFVDHKESGVSRASELARTVPAWEISYSEGLDAANVLNSAF